MKKNLILSLIIVLIIILIGILISYLFYDYAVDSSRAANEDGLLFEIHDASLNCETVSLEVYNDRSYKLYYVTGNLAVPKVGVYNYNIDSLIDSFRKSNSGKYLITTGLNLQYHTDEYNSELIKFLNSIDVSLDECKVN